MIDVATVAANIEHCFNSQFNNGRTFYTDDGENYKIVGRYTFDGNGTPKAIALMDDDGNVFVHFNGTGDGNWKYNAAAYGAEPQPSDMQSGCLDWFNSLCADLRGKYSGKLYVTGHSQGGNNAMFVNIRSDYSDMIENCVSLDGPNFSDKFVEDTIAGLGDEEFNRRCSKIFAFNGENDFVSILGQVSIIPKDNIKYIKYTGDGDFAMYHMIEGMLNKSFKLEISENGSSQVRETLKKFVDRVLDLEAAEQIIASEGVMALCENFIGGESEPLKANFTNEDLTQLKQVLLPVIVKFLSDESIDIKSVLSEVMGVDPSEPNDLIDGIVGVLGVFYELSEQDRTKFLEAVFDMLTVEDNNIVIDFSKIDDMLKVVTDIINDNYIDNPENLMKLFEELGIKNEPLRFAATFLVVVYVKLNEIGINPISEKFSLLMAKLDFVLSVLYTFGLGDDAVNLVIKIFTAIHNFVTSVNEWWRNNFDAGVKYASQNPYLKADTEKLRNYATRIANVNRRLKYLDNAMNSLYWQVNLLDLWDILCANLITAPTYSLRKAQDYLNNTASRLESAENAAAKYVGV